MAHNNSSENEIKVKRNKEENNMLETKKQLREIIETKSKQIKSRDKKIDEQKEEILEWQRENKALYDENKELRYENDELQEFKNKIISIVYAKATLVDKYDKIKELVNDFDSNY